MADRLILFAHGARDPAWRAPLDALAARLREQLPGADVDCAFLELMTPSLQQAVDAAAAAGARRIAVAPVFWAAGKHLLRDVPALLQQSRTAHPGVSIEMWPVMGEREAVLRALADDYGAQWRAAAGPPPP
ncbi:MAG: sirohydrochlorin chelatase [Burkholderiaceae bacterium]